MTTRLTARYPGQCVCGCGVSRGDSIEYDRRRRQIIGCRHCRNHAAPDRTDIDYEDSCSAACGFSPFGGPEQ